MGDGRAEDDTRTKNDNERETATGHGGGRNAEEPGGAGGADGIAPAGRRPNRRKPGNGTGTGWNE